MMGLAFEVHDSVNRDTKKSISETKDVKEDAEQDLEREFKSIQKPTAEDIFHYAFCHAGILTGITKLKNMTFFICFNYVKFLYACTYI